jgi:hypothetical protein
MTTAQRLQLSQEIPSPYKTIGKAVPSLKNIEKTDKH